jgi:RNA polymerase sigma factor, sigma-70 family
LDSSRHLVLLAKEGRDQALKELVVRHVPALRGYVRLKMGGALREHESASDVVQSVCREVLGDLSGFEYRGEGAFRHWLFTAAERKLRDRARYWGRAKRDGARTTPLEPGSQAHEVLDAYASIASPSQDAIATEELARIERAFDALPESYRQVILLSRVVGLDTEEIAREISQSSHYTRTLLSRSLARLASLLHDSAPGS